MKISELKIADTAKENIQYYRDQIAQDEPEIAKVFVRKTREVGEMLQQFPELGKLSRYDTKGKIYWKQIGGYFKAYMLLYVIEDDILKVIRLIHGSRDLPEVFDQIRR